jgi:mono/diheme cytochrome c family protein
VVARGEALFQTHCAICHGREGRGDGPSAAGLNPQPADLTATHVDDHTDGDIFWWLTYGIAGTAMPSFEQTLSEIERWELIHFIRSLRHGVPAAAAFPGAPASPVAVR